MVQAAPDDGQRQALRQAFDTGFVASQTLQVVQAVTQRGGGRGRRGEGVVGGQYAEATPAV